MASKFLSLHLFLVLEVLSVHSQSEPGHARDKRRVGFIPYFKRPVWKALSDKVTSAGEFSYLAHLYTVGAERVWSNECSGTILTPRHVLTAAQCSVKDITDYIVWVGSKKWDEPGQTTEVDKIFIHPEFSVKPGGTAVFDLAVWRTVDELILNENVWTMDLPQGVGDTGPPTPLNDATPFNCHIVGGPPSGKDIVPNLFNYSPVKLVPPAECNKISNKLFSSDIWTNRSVLCGKPPWARVRFDCRGASVGGGLVCGGGKGNRTVLGVVTHSPLRGCPLLFPPMFFARVDTNLDFIKGSIENFSHCKRLPTLLITMMIIIIFILL